MNQPFIPTPCGLLPEEPLLIEQSREGRCGVDLPNIKGTPTRTGLPERETVGLPQVTEQQAIRHFVRLSQRNYSIDAGFYPLGSCTMKHNPRQNEKLARLPGFAAIHPLQPQSTVQGALAIMHKLQDSLATLTGLPGVSLAPAAGAHGEMAGIMVIRSAHEAKGNRRHVILIPDSAHGTNPATAALCGYDIKTIPTTKQGFVDVAAFADAVNDDVAGMMLTNPSTVGLFDPNILEISALLKKVGAYFYCDGANFNAIVGKVRPADFGVDVMHINLHKTFSTPHGGGGPGSGPIAVTSELSPYLPVPRVVKDAKGYHLINESNTAFGRVKGFHGQFGMAVRALSYILAHGADGLRQAAEDAVLNANYIFARLKDLYHAPFEGPCMHECLLTDKHQKAKGITTMEIAKTLVEFGYHPMTVFFPLVVQGAMLIEPTESENKETIDQFIDTMRYIATEIEEGRGDIFKEYPRSTPRRKLDEVSAARNPRLTWAELEKIAETA